MELVVKVAPIRLEGEVGKLGNKARIRYALPCRRGAENEKTRWVTANRGRVVRMEERQMLLAEGGGVATHPAKQKCNS